MILQPEHWGMPTKHVISDLNEVEFLQIYFVANIIQKLYYKKIL